jgi:hypothetical protein
MSKNKNHHSREGLTIQFIPFSEISSLTSTERIRKLLQIILKNKVIVIQGRLRMEEETRLIEDTMVMVGSVKGFKGIELAVISPNPDSMSMMRKVKHGIASALVGDTESLTIIGPASIIKEMKRDPSKLEVMMNKN